MSTATYKRVFRNIVNGVRAGSIRSGTPISARRLARDFNVNKNTGHRILTELHRHGLVEITPGKTSKLVFKPNFAIDEFQTEDTETATRNHIVLLSCNPIASIQSNFVTMELIEAFSREAQRRDLVLEVIHAKEEDFSRIGETLCESGQVLGVGVTSLAQYELRQYIAEAGIPMISLSIPSHGEADYDILTDDFAAMHMAVEHLWTLGHQRIGYIGGGPDTILKDRFHGYFVSMLERRGAPVPEQWLYCLDHTSRYSQADFMPVLTDMLQADDRPTALIIASDFAAFVAAPIFTTLGFSIPGDLAFVTYDNSYLATESIPRWTSISVERGRTACEAVNLMLECATGQRPEAQKRVFTPELIVRDSCGARKKS